MRMKRFFTVFLFFLIVGNAYTLDDSDIISNLAIRYGIKPSLAISIIIEGSNNIFKESDAAKYYSLLLANGVPLGIMWGDFSPVTRAEANTIEYRQYWLVRYIAYLHHPDFKFTPWQIAAAFYCGSGNVSRGNITTTGKAFADRVINNIPLYTSYDK